MAGFLGAMNPFGMLGGGGLPGTGGGGGIGGLGIGTLGADAETLSGPGAGYGGLTTAFAGGDTPQQQGWGIKPVTDPFQSYQTQGPTDQSAYAGTNPNMNFMGPTMSQQHYQAAQNYARGPQGTNRAEEWYQQYPQELASLDPYYAQARQRTMEDMDKALAARGMSRSGAGNQAIGDAMTNLAAQQANREAQHQLQYQGLGGQLARSADISSLGTSQDELGWLQGMGGLAGQADAAKRAQGRDFMGDIAMGMGAAMPVMQQGYGQMLGQDWNLFNSALGPAAARENLNQNIREQERQKADEAHGMSMFGNLLGGLF